MALEKKGILKKFSALPSTKGSDDFLSHHFFGEVAQDDIHHPSNKVTPHTSVSKKDRQTNSPIIQFKNWPALHKFALQQYGHMTGLMKTFDQKLSSALLYWLIVDPKAADLLPRVVELWSNREAFIQFFSSKDIPPEVARSILRYLARNPVPTKGPVSSFPVIETIHRPKVSPVSQPTMRLVSADGSLNKICYSWQPFDDEGQLGLLLSKSWIEFDQLAWSNSPAWKLNPFFIRIESRWWTYNVKIMRDEGDSAMKVDGQIRYRFEEGDHTLQSDEPDPTEQLTIQMFTDKDEAIGQPQICRIVAI